jgi:uncharacterized protein (TIGR02118 family)
MIKTLVFVRRKPGMTFDDFARYWVETHGPVAAKLPGLRRLVTNLVRPELQRHEPPWDGLSCAWFESADAVRSVVSTPEFRAMIDDEENFVDTSERSPMIVTPYSPAAEAPMSTEGLSDTIKTVVAIWRKSGMEREDFNTYWRNTHAELICNLPNLRAYVQNTTRIDMQRREPLCDAIAECWWTSWDGVLDAVKSAAYATVQADEKRFVDTARLSPMVVREVEVVRDGKLQTASP